MLYYDDRCLDLPIFPLCSADGIVDESRSSSSLASHALAALGRRTGFHQKLTFHAARRDALLEVDSKPNLNISYQPNPLPARPVTSQTSVSYAFNRGRANMIGKTMSQITCEVVESWELYH